MDSKEYFYELFDKNGRLAAYAKVSNLRTNRSKEKVGDIKIFNLTNFKIHRTAGTMSSFTIGAELINNKAEIAKLKLLGL